MHYFRLKRRAKRPVLLFLTGLMLSMSVLSSNIITAYALDPADPGSGVRIPAVSTVSTSTLSHSHRGDSVNGGVCYCVPNYHRHIGNKTSGGKCYKAEYHSHNSGCYKNCTTSGVSLEYVNSVNTYCSIHGSSERVNYILTVRHSACGQPNERKNVFVACTQCGGDPSAQGTSVHQYLSCTKTSSTIDSYKLNCGKTEGVDIDSYDLGCGLEEKDYATLTLTNTTPEWTAGLVTLTGTLYDPDEAITGAGYGALTFASPDGIIDSSGTGSVYVSANGTYTLSTSIDESHFDSSQASVMLTVSNIDRTAPGISSVSYDTGENWLTSSNITVDAADLQPDGSEGSGLHDLPYSFDGGQSWQAGNTYTVTSNQVVDIRVRDYCGNTESASADITNIDNTPPTVSWTCTPEVWYPRSGARKFVISAEDNESGLAEYAYSYDNGESWTSDSEIFREIDGAFHVLVRDALGNITDSEIENTYSEEKKDDDEDDDKKDDDKKDDDKKDDDKKDDDKKDDDKKDDDKKDDDKKDDDKKDDDKKDDDKKDDDKKDDDKKDDDKKGDDKKDDDKKGDDKKDDTKDDDRKDDDAGDNTNDDPAGGITDEDSGSDGGLTDADIKYPWESDSTKVDLPEASLSGPEADVTSKERAPFYRTPAFKTTAAVGGSLLGLLILFLLILLLYSGVIVLTYDGDKYRFTSIRPIRRSERGNYIFLSEDIMECAYSSKYKLIVGRLYVLRHKNELLGINADGDWTSVNVEHYIYVVLK